MGLLIRAAKIIRRALVERPLQRGFDWLSPNGFHAVCRPQHHVPLASDDASSWHGSGFDQDAIVEITRESRTRSASRRRSLSSDFPRQGGNGRRFNPGGFSDSMHRGLLS